MAKSKEQRITLTYNEILILAYKSLERELKEWEEKRGQGMDELIDYAVVPYKKKIELLDRMYEQENGSHLY